MKYSELITKQRTRGKKTFQYQPVPAEIFWNPTNGPGYGLLRQALSGNLPLGSVTGTPSTGPVAPSLAPPQPWEMLPGMTPETWNEIISAVERASSSDYVDPAQVERIAAQLHASPERLAQTIRAAANDLRQVKIGKPELRVLDNGDIYMESPGHPGEYLKWEGPGWYASRSEFPEGKEVIVTYKVAEPYETGDVSQIATSQGLGTPELLHHPWDWAQQLPGDPMSTASIDRALKVMSNLGVPRDLIDNAYREAWDMLSSGIPAHEIRKKLARDLVRWLEDFRFQDLPKPLQEALRARGLGTGTEISTKELGEAELDEVYEILNALAEKPTEFYVVVERYPSSGRLNLVRITTSPPEPYVNPAGVQQIEVLGPYSSQEEAEQIRSQILAGE